MRCIAARFAMQAGISRITRAHIRCRAVTAVTGANKATDRLDPGPAAFEIAIVGADTIRDRMIESSMGRLPASTAPASLHASIE